MPNGCSDCAGESPPPLPLPLPLCACVCDIFLAMLTADAAADASLAGFDYAATANNEANDAAQLIKMSFRFCGKAPKSMQSVSPLVTFANRQTFTLDQAHTHAFVRPVAAHHVGIITPSAISHQQPLKIVVAQTFVWVSCCPTGQMLRNKNAPTHTVTHTRL